LSLDRINKALRRKSKETQVPFEHGEYDVLLKQYRASRKIEFKDLLASMKRSGDYYPFPIRAQPDVELFFEHPEWTVSKKMAKASAKAVKDWGPSLFADVKFDGARTLLYVNPKTKEVKLYSRRLKELHKMEDKYTTAILNNVSKLIVDETVFDTEAYEPDYEGKLLPFGTVLGWVRNPDDAKYQNLLPSIETFDMVMLNGKDIREMPLKYRKRLLEAVIKKRDGLVLDVADTRLMKNHPRPIEWRFKAIIKGKGEGLVLKHPAEEYYYGKKSIKSKGWVKLKAGDTLDLELKAIEVSPRGKPFKDYRHWHMVTADNELHEVKANKAIVAAKFDNEFYRNFSLDMINQWKLGRLVAAGRMVDVDKDLVKFYDVKKVPTRLTYPKNKRMIVEIFTERITETLHPSGTKIVGIREDKKVADKMKDIKELRRFFLAIKEE